MANSLLSSLRWTTIYCEQTAQHRTLKRLGRASRLSTLATSTWVRPELELSWKGAPSVISLQQQSWGKRSWIKKTLQTVRQSLASPVSTRSSARWIIEMCDIQITKKSSSGWWQCAVASVPVLLPTLSTQPMAELPGKRHCWKSEECEIQVVCTMSQIAHFHFWPQFWFSCPYLLSNKIQQIEFAKRILL